MVFPGKGRGSHQCKHQENEAGDFEPELMQHGTKVPKGRPNAAEERAVGAGAPNLLSRNACRNPQFLSGGNVSHASRFYQPQALEYEAERYLSAR